MTRKQTPATVTVVAETPATPVAVDFCTLVEQRRALDAQIKAAKAAAKASKLDPLIARQNAHISEWTGVCSGEVWVEWVTGNDGLEGGEQRHALFSKGGKIPTQTSERIRAPV